MKYIWTIAQNDLLIAAKERESFLLGLLMPVLMMLLLGVAMPGEEAEGTIPIDIIDRDHSDLSALFIRLIDQEMQAGEGGFTVCSYTAEQPDSDCNLPATIASQPEKWDNKATNRLEDTDTYGVIIIDAGFAEALRAGQQVTVLYKNNNSLSAPTLAQQKINAAVSRMGGSVLIANAAVNTADARFNASAITRDQVFGAALAEAESAWNSTPIQVLSSGTDKKPSHVGFNQSGPGIATMFVMMSVLGAAAVLVLERERGTLQRLYTLPMPKGQIIAGKLLGRYVYGVIQYIMLVTAGTLFGVEWGGSPLGIALIILVFPLTAAALGLALATVVRTTAQAASISLLMGLTLAPLGGAWWPMEIVPDFMKIIGHVSPIAWAMDAFQEMMYYGGGVLDILPMLGVLLAMAALFFGFGVWRFRYE